jgi:hypothetical protein
MGFLRDNAYPAMVLLTDEDDCSASHPDVLFNPDPEMDNIDSDLGYLHAFRCFEFGVICDINDRTIVFPCSTTKTHLRFRLMSVCRH